MKYVINDSIILEKIMLTQPVGFNKLLALMKPQIKTARTLTKRLKKLESNGYIDWEKKKLEGRKHKLEGRGHTSQISVTSKVLEKINLENKYNEFLEKLYQDRPDEKIKIKSHDIIKKRLGDVGLIKKMQVLNDLNEYITPRQGIIDEYSTMFSKLPYTIELSKEEIDKLKIEAVKAHIPFKKYCRKKLLS